MRGLCARLAALACLLARLVVIAAVLPARPEAVTSAALLAVLLVAVLLVAVLLVADFAPVTRLALTLIRLRLLGALGAGLDRGLITQALRLTA